MKRFASFLTVCLFALTWTSCTPMQTPPPPTPSPIPISEESSTFRIVAYATDAIIPELIPYQQLTHINYSFLIPNNDGTFAPLNNTWKLETIIFNAHSQNVLVSLAVGGWGWDNEFEQMAANPESRSAFVKNLSEIVNQYQLDGVDIDWEYPDPGQSSQNYLALMHELRAALPEKLISTATVGYGDDPGLGIPKEVFGLVDYVNVMTYDGEEHGSLQEFKHGLSYWTDRGVPPEKINMGVPFYSRPNEISYAKLIEADPASAQVDLFNYLGTAEHYNGMPTIQRKTEIAMKNAGGIMFWALDLDAPGEYSLVNTIYKTINTVK